MSVDQGGSPPPPTAPPTDSPQTRPAAPEKKPRNWKRIALWVGAGLLVVGSVGAVSGKDTEIKDLQKQLLAAEDRADAAAGDASKQAEDAKQSAAADLADDRAAMEADIAQRSATLDQREATIKGREDAVAAREQAVNAAEQGKKASQISSDGVYEVGRDIQAGKYHTDGSGDTCYYALLGADGQDIIDNNNVDGPVTLTINSPYFETNGCGTWSKVG